MTVSDRRLVETAAIELATTYAVANGYAADDRRAIGLVLVGIVLGSRAPDVVRSELFAGYIAVHPDAAPALIAYLDALVAAHEGDR